MTDKGSVRQTLEKALDKALSIQQPAVAAHVRRIRRGRPDAAPSEVLAALEKHYLATVTTLGAAAGSSSAVPGVGTTVGIAVNLAAIPAFAEATVLFVLASAEVHGVHVDDLERRRTLVIAVLLGDGASKIVQKMAGRTGAHWGRAIAQSVPLDTIRAINRVLGRNFVTRYGTKEGILVRGREIPLGIGAAIGAAGNAAGGWAGVRAARKVFGPPPQGWPGPAAGGQDDDGPVNPQPVDPEPVDVEPVDSAGAQEPATAIA
jgi:hypothetical protein